jgi:HD-GYP domain-containing protein (c-di-GMP phosphodiesterase class II)
MSKSSLRSLGYLPVSTATLCAASVLNFDLYVQHPGRAYAELYRERDYPLQDDDLERLRQEGVDHLYIRLNDTEAYRQYLSEHVFHDSGVPPAVRLKALREITRTAFEDALRAGNCDHMVTVASSFGRDLVGMLAEHTPAFQELFKALDHDYYTFTHACNVSTYCALIAIRLSTVDSVELAELAAGAILHDIGKRHIPVHVLNKSGKLTDEEWELVRQHPVTGYRELASRGDLNFGQLMMVYQHHERLDGTGYPAGVMGDEIHPWAKICAVADVFDAMSCKRPYRTAVPLVDVCDHLRKLAGLRYDPDAVECWTAGFVKAGRLSSAAE